MVERRTVLVLGALTGLGLQGCSGGSSSDPNSPAPPPPNTERAKGWNEMPAEIYNNTPLITGRYSEATGYTAFDLTDSTFLAQIGFPTLLPSPSNQGSQPSCTAWAVGYAAATQTLRASDRNFLGAFSPADLFTKIQRRLSPSACTQGSHINYAMDVLVQEGVATLEAVPYSEAQCGLIQNAPGRNLDGFSRVSSADAGAIKGSLQSMQPVSFGILTNNAFLALNPSNNVFVPDGTGGGHAMTLVGYDEGRQQYKIMNSWGTDWGDSGFCWISYANFARFALDVCLPFVRRSPSEPFEGSSSVSSSPIVMQHMKTRRFGSGTPGSYGVGVELGWSSPLAVEASTISVLDNSRNILFTQNFSFSQIARGLRFGASVPDGSAAYQLVRSTVTGRDSSNTRLTLTSIARPAGR